MRDAYTTTLDRYRQNRETQLSSASDRVAKAQQEDARARGTFLAGVRVLDLTSGLDGVVVDRTAASATPFGMVPVQLQTGELVNRFRRELLERPTPPRV